MFCRAIFSKAPSEHDHYTVTWLVFLKQTQAKEAESSGEAGRGKGGESKDVPWPGLPAGRRAPNSSKKQESTSPLRLVFKKCFV